MAALRESRQITARESARGVWAERWQCAFAGAAGVEVIAHQWAAVAVFFALSTCCAVGARSGA